MSSIGARLFTAASANFLYAAILLVPVLHSASAAQDCGQSQLTPQQKLERFRDLDKQAESAMQQKRFSEAVGLYREAACLAPRSPHALYDLGTAEAASGDFLAARDSFHAADAIQPTSALPLVMQVRVNFSLNDIEALKGNLREAATRFPQDGHLHALLARFLAEKKLLVLALAEALRSQTDAAVPESKLQLAVLENAVGAYDDSVRNATAVEEKPGTPGTLRASASGIAGLSYESLGEQDQAIRHLRQAIQLDPLKENSYLALADLFEQTHKYGDAVQVLIEARSNLPNSTALLLPLGSNLVRTQRYSEGIAALRELLRRSPNEEEAYLRLADAYRQTGSSDQEALTLLDLAQRNPAYPMIHVLIARAMLSEAHVDYAKVLDQLSQAEKADPLDPDLFYLRGKVYLAMNRNRDAISCLRRSIELRPMETGPYYQLARLYQKLGDSKLAAEQFARVKYLENALPGGNLSNAR